MAGIRVGIPRTGVDWFYASSDVPSLTGLQATGLTKYLGNELREDDYDRLTFSYDPVEGELSVMVRPAEPMNDDLGIRVKQLINEYSAVHF